MKVLFIDTTHITLANGLEQLGFETELDNVSLKEEIEKKLHNYQGVVIRSRFKIDKQFLNAGKHLKFIGRVGAGLENIDIEHAEKLGINLLSAPEGNRNAVGEHALAMLLSMFNNLNRADIQVRNGVWIREGNRGVELRGKTVGLIGYGNMGNAFSRVLSGMGVNVIFHDLKLGLSNKNGTQVELAELFEKTDVLSIHTPLTELTNGMINSSFLSKFSKNIYFVNTARGPITVTEDLVEMLKSGKVLGACLDVLEYEKTSFENMFSEKNKLPDAFQYLISSDKTILSPHIAGWTQESNVKMAQTIVDKVKNVIG
ncbi:MAG: hydroxyacid dehydrogenase [Ichthyobacteriaceae bacterium]|nr:hydroxyacid dehydrogenase [Ichthyobacteriaceae bacterium]